MLQTLFIVFHLHPSLRSQSSESYSRTAHSPPICESLEEPHRVCLTALHLLSEMSQRAVQVSAASIRAPV